MKKIILTTIMLLSCFVMAYADGDEDNDENAKELFLEKCNVCHTASYATDIKNTEEDWRIVVMRMKDDNGADVTDEEAEEIIEYLTEHYGK